MTFKNEAQLKKFLIEKCIKAVGNTERKVYTEFSGNLNQFYSEFKPEEYIRTGALYNSLEATGAKSSGNSVSAEVYFNVPSYNQGLMPLQHTPEHGMYGWATWSGETVLEVAMESGVPHGGYKEGTAIWTESMAEFGGKEGIRNLLKQELKKQGL